jgi:hypothetical protein
MQPRTGEFDIKPVASSTNIRLSGRFEINGEPLMVGDSYWNAFSK